MTNVGSATVEAPGIIHVVIVDDHALLREGTRQILERAGDFRVVGEAANGQEALEVIAEQRPDVLLLDMRLPDMNGVETARRIMDEAPDVKVLILSAFDEIDYVQAALSAGVAGYLLKTTPGDELVQAIRAAYGGVTVLDPRLSSSVANQPAAGRGAARIGSLTAREREVVKLVAQGLPNKVIAAQLGISPRTVEGHLNHVFEKLGTGSRAALVRLAMVNGLVDGP